MVHMGHPPPAVAAPHSSRAGRGAETEAQVAALEMRLQRTVAEAEVGLKQRAAEAEQARAQERQRQDAPAPSCALLAGTTPATPLWGMPSTISSSRMGAPTFNHSL